MATNKEVKVTLKTRDDMQAPTKNMPVILGNSETDLRGAAGLISGTTYLGFQFHPDAQGLPTLNAVCEVHVKDEHDIEVEGGVVRAKDFLTEDEYQEAVYRADNSETNIVIRWKMVSGVVTAIVFVEGGSQLNANAECRAWSGVRLPAPIIPGTDPTACIVSSPVAFNPKRCFKLYRSGVLKVGPVAMPAFACCTFHYLAHQE